MVIAFGEAKAEALAAALRAPIHRVDHVMIATNAIQPDRNDWRNTLTEPA